MNSKMSIPILLRHRWTAEPAFGVWVCLPRAIVLNPSLEDPSCNGCRAVIDYEELPDRDKYPDSESLQFRLDLLFAELALKEVQHHVDA